VKIRSKGENVASTTGSGRFFKLTLALAAAAALIVSCSGSVKNPEGAVDKMLKAYGGEKNVPLLINFEGRGFMKQLPPGHVATNHQFDIFQREMTTRPRHTRSARARSSIFSSSS